MVGLQTLTASLLVLLLPLLAASARVSGIAELKDINEDQDTDGGVTASDVDASGTAGLEDVNDPKPKADKSGTHAAAEQKLQQIRDALTKLQRDIAGAGTTSDVNSLKAGIKSMMGAVCDCDAQLPEELSLATAQQILAGVDARIKSAEQVLNSGSDLPSAQIIEKKLVLHGVLLQVPPVRNSFSDTVVQFKAGIAPKGLVDPRDSRKKEFTSHFTSVRMSQMAALAGMTFGSSSTEMLPGQDTVMSGAASGILGPIGSALGLASLMHIAGDLEGRKSTMVKEEVELEVVWEPRGAVAIDFDDLELVEPALKFLDGIVEEEDEEYRKSEIVKFLRRYGSHVCHKVTLGGTRQRRSILRTSNSVSSTEARLALRSAGKKDQADEVVKTSNDPLAGVRGAPLGFGYSGEGGSLQDLVTIEKETNGGASDLPQGLWTESLASNENWEIIDRHVRDCTPIWDFAHRDRKRFGRQLEKELFAVWYKEFLHLKEFARKYDVPLPEDLTTEEKLVEWIASQYQMLEPSIKINKMCDATGWCGGHGNCGPETHGRCECREGYELQEGTCVAANFPRLGNGGISGFSWLLQRLGEAADESGMALLEAGRESGALWDDLFYPWLQMVAGEDSSLKGVKVGYFEEAMESIINDAETEAELLQVMEKTLQGQAALIKIFDNPRYLRQLAQDAEDLAVILRLDGAAGYLKKLLSSAGDDKAGIESLLDLAATAPARHSLATKLSIFSERLSDPEFVSSARSSMQQRMASLRKIVGELTGSGGRREVAKLLAARAQQLLAESKPGGAEGASEKPACIPCKVKDALVRRVLPLQGQVSSGLAEGLERLEGDE